jgi:hypothetical protein
MNSRFNLPESPLHPAREVSTDAGHLERMLGLNAGGFFREAGMLCGAEVCDQRIACLAAFAWFHLVAFSFVGWEP